jgi:glycyl-tRNA synthetase beta chain
MSELLFEIGTEEIPAGYIQPALTFLATQTEKKLQDLGLTYKNIATYATPRRLTLTVDYIEEKQPDRMQEYVGPSRQAGFDSDGNPTKAAIGFARSRGLQPEELQVVETPKGEYLMAIEDVKGQDTMSLLPEILEGLATTVVFPKSMRWSDTTMTFTRPIQWLLALYGGQVIPFSLENISSGNTTRGHRFMAPDTIEISSANQYVSTLDKSYVIADMATQLQMVVDEVKAAVKDRAGIDGAVPVLHEGLIDTVTNLVERPYGICGSFDEKFLQLPDEALITSMREHQKYFPVANGKGELLPRFVAVNNTDIEDTDLAASGHERVLRARLEDGLFFFNEDKKFKLSDRIDNLKGIIFQHKLGTMLEKTERMQKLASLLAEAIAPDLKDDAVSATRLAKGDLLTEMVGEFPSLQGTMGKEYALSDGEKPEVAQAIVEHYMPIRAGSELPASLLGAIVGIADRMDTLAGCFAIGERPTGNKDAFGLRRQAIGLLHILEGLNIRLSLSAFLKAALDNVATQVDIPANTLEDIIDFIKLRFENDQIASGKNQEAVIAATTVVFDDPLDCIARIQALDTIRSQENFSVLAGAYKRIRNIIKDNQDTEVNEQLLTEDAEQRLFSTLTSVKEKALPMLRENDYDQALVEMLEMKAPVDQFFDNVMVMADDAAVKQNRLNLLTALGELILMVGDISKMHTE